MNNKQPSMHLLMEEITMRQGLGNPIPKTKPCNPAAVLVLAVVVGVIILSAYAIITSRVDHKKHIANKHHVIECTETTQKHP